MTIGLLLAVVLQSPAADSLRAVAKQLPESDLVAHVRGQSLPAREAVPGALASNDLEGASRIALAYAVAWGDSFLVAEVKRFVSWPTSARASKVWADSIRRSGNAVFGRAGAVAAVAIWHRALRRSAAIGDTAGMAAASGNIGAAFSHEGETDSALAFLERARTLARHVGDRRVEANAVAELAGVREQQGDLAGARAGYAEALALRERIGDSRGVAADHNNLGLLALDLGDLAEARRQFNSALARNRSEGRDDVAATNRVNLATVEALEGNFTTAEAEYREALNVWRSRSAFAEVADALSGLGQLELRRGDYPAARAALSEALAIYRRTGPLASTVAAQRDLGAALAALGQLQSALDTLRRAERLADSARLDPGVRAGIALVRADLSAQLNTLADAERLYRSAELLYRQAGDMRGQADAQEGQGMLHRLRGDPARGRQLLDAAMRNQRAAGDRRAAAISRLELGRLEKEHGQPAVARRQLARAAVELDSVGDQVAVAAALAERAAVEAKAGQAAVAESLYRAGLTRLESRIAPGVTGELRAGLGLALEAQGLPDQAVRELRLALAEFERPGRSLAMAERRAAFFADKWDTYGHLARIELSRGRLAEAFDASERLRAREMLELLARGRVPAPTGAAQELIQREQDLKRHIAALTGALERDSAVERTRGPEMWPSAKGGGFEALLSAQDAYGTLLLEMKERSGRHANLVSPATATWRDVAAQVGPEEVFVEYLLGDSSSVAFIVARDTIAAVHLAAGRRELARLVEFARGMLEPPRAPSVDSLWRAPLRRLYRHLIAPIEETGLLEGRVRLVLVPHDQLHYLPFAALLDEGAPERFLAEQFELLEVPSASVWLALGRRPAGRPGHGVLGFAPRPEVLIGSRREGQVIERLGGDAVQVLIGSAATEEAFRRKAPTARILHLATFGVLNKQNPLFSHVELAAGGGHDGRLEVHEVFGLDLAADLVVLSACQTGLGSGTLGDVPRGDDWVGLTRAFLHAGAARVVATLWPVADRETAALIERFYAGLAGGADAVRSLAAAQRAMIADPRMSHPSFWAGFVAVGGGGAERTTGGGDRE